MSIAPKPHRRTERTTNDWLTPRWLVERLGPFHLDPCASDHQIWPTALKMLKPSETDGLKADWRDQLVWLNPPYGRDTHLWLGRMADPLHRNGIALVFARLETRMFFDHVWPVALAMLHLRGRLDFCYAIAGRHYNSRKKRWEKHEAGEPAGHNSGGPSVCIAYGGLARERLRKNKDLGVFVDGWDLPDESACIPISARAG